MITEQLIEKLRSQIQMLYRQTWSIDQRNSEIKSDRFKYREYFNRQLFRCDSTALVDYVKEAEQNFNHLIKLRHSDKALLSQLGEQLTDQLSALTQVIRANEVAIKEHFYQKQTAKKRYQKKASKPNQYEQKMRNVAKFVMKNSHELHQELAQNHEFERRLNEMIYERQAQITKASQAQQQQLQKEILALHQRLGRCRRAITAVEEKIAMAERLS